MVSIDLCLNIFANDHHVHKAALQRPSCADRGVGEAAISRRPKHQQTGPKQRKAVRWSNEIIRQQTLKRPYVLSLRPIRSRSHNAATLLLVRKPSENRCHGAACAALAGHFAESRLSVITASHGEPLHVATFNMAKIDCAMALWPKISCPGELLILSYLIYLFIYLLNMFTTWGWKDMCVLQVRYFAD